MKGQMLYSKPINTNGAVINVTSYTKGAYMVKLANNNRIYTEIFIKE